LICLFSSPGPTRHPHPSLLPTLSRRATRVATAAGQPRAMRQRSSFCVRPYPHRVRPPRPLHILARPAPFPSNPSPNPPLPTAPSSIAAVGSSSPVGLSSIPHAGSSLSPSSFDFGHNPAPSHTVQGRRCRSPPSAAQHCHAPPRRRSTPAPPLVSFAAIPFTPCARPLPRSGSASPRRRRRARRVRLRAVATPTPRSGLALP
jgi:hypothetical protein